ncbi:MAG: glutamine-hydrolyzing GMP synthase [Candidatus Omnitrophica bacterium]|nr:glutamine-hydrolyzing GMP synthase [Candidatus Omnitrophota bacterium]
MAKDWIAILDFGSQYTRLIARRIRENGAYSEILPYNTPAKKIRFLKPNGLILSGGPASVVSKNSPCPDKDIFSLGIPVLGICYGAQLMAKLLGGCVGKASAGEYGSASLRVVESRGLLNGIGPYSVVWMSHGDKITRLPAGFSLSAKTGNSGISVMQDIGKKLYAVQFHPEVGHTVDGAKILKNFIFDICACHGRWSMGSFAQEAVKSIREKTHGEKVLCGLSGGVDSSVLALLLHKAIGGKLKAVFIDNGLLRSNEAAIVEKRFRRSYRIGLKCVDSTRVFLKALKGVTEPEKKRKIIGKVFIDVFEKQARSFGDIKFLAQGTLYPDIIESRSAAGGPSAVIKTHHNVGGLPNKMKFKLIEPLKELFKDEVRLLGKELGMPDELVYRHPFPGPGLAVRIIGDITKAKLDTLRKADAILIDEIKCSGLYSKLWQAFCVFLPVNTVGVMGDERTYKNVICVRAVTSNDAMTADWARLPDNVLQKVSSRIINEVEGINRVVYDISSKPPSTIEWE